MWNKNETKINRFKTFSRLEQTFFFYPLHVALLSHGRSENGHFSQSEASFNDIDYACGDIWPYRDHVQIPINNLIVSAVYVNSR